jgi:NADPH-dependent 2,4-dienoyl-CoA reductase/sulfur reductase-like enzyme
LAAELVLFAIGVEPEIWLARAAGINIGKSGAIEVDRLQQTSAEGIYAAGDCCESWHRLLERGEFIPRGTTANKQGRIAGANLTGAREQFAGVLGTSITKVFGLEVGHTGLFEQQAEQKYPRTRSVTITARTRAHAYPGSKEISIKLVFNGSSGKLLGAQMVGGEQVAKRLDVIAAAIQAGWTVEELAGLDASYAPPYAPVWDPILVAANQARKKG